MYRRRPRFGLPELVSPPRPPRLVPSLVGLVAALALTLSACSSTVDQSATDGPDDGTAEATEPDGGTSNDSGSDGGAFGDGDSETTDPVSFGDPADAGFEEVEEPEPAPVPVDDDDREVLSAPADVIPEIEEQLDAAPEAEEILDTVAIIDKAPVDDGEDKGRSAVGGLALLDEPASLACAHIEISLTLIDEGNPSEAVARVRSAGEQAEGSELSTVRSWSSPITDAIVDGEVADFAPLIGFLSVCAEGGYEL